MLISLLVKAGSSTGLLLPVRVPLANQLGGHLLLLTIVSGKNKSLIS
jgi:hypothetical protein